MSWAVALYLVVCVFGAGIVRGYGGFGFSLLVVTSVSLALTPAEIIPPVFMMEVAASLVLLPGIWRDIHWSAIGWLSFGCLLGTPFGVWLLASVPAAPMKIALAVAVMAAVALLASGYARKSMPNTGGTVATGVVSGLLNGAFGIGGIPVAVFFFSSPAAVAVGRASLIAFFIGIDTAGLGFLAGEGLLSLEAFYRFLLVIPALFIGQWVGARSFRRADPAMFRRWVLALLVVLGFLTGLQGLREALAN